MNLRRIIEKLEEIDRKLEEKGFGDKECFIISFFGCLIISFVVRMTLIMLSRGMPVFHF